MAGLRRIKVLSRDALLRVRIGRVNRCGRAEARPYKIPVKKICLINLALAVVLLIGCSKQPMPQYVPELEAIAEAMDSTHWNKPCPQIEQIDPARLHTRADSALYSLLAYANLKRSGHYPPADSLIATATDFYADGREPRRAMMAWYFRACSNWDQERFAEAIYYALHMRPYAEQLADTLYLMRFCDVMATSFERANNYLEAARYYTQALRYMQAKPDLEPTNYPYFVRQAVDNWSQAGYVDSALTVFRSHISLLLGQETNPEWVVHHLYTYHRCVRTSTNADYEQIARDYDAIDAIPLAHHVMDSLAFMGLERDYYQAKVRNPKAVDSLLPLLHAAGVDTINLQHPRSLHRIPGVVEAQQMYLAEVQAREADKAMARRTRLLLIWGCVILVLLVGFGVWFYRRRMARKKEELLTRMDELRELQAEMSANNELIDKLFAQRLQEINRLCDNYYNHRDSGEKAKSVFYREFESRLADLSSRQTIAEIEQLVNECKDGLVARLRQELPQLKEQDVNFLTYIYAGFAARTVCLFMGITKDNYYMRRRRIKARLAASAAPSAPHFLAEMRS